MGEYPRRGALDVVGLGVAESRGIRRGVVVNLEAAVDSIKKAIEEAELMAGVEIDSVHLALSGPHIKGFNSRGVIAVAGKNREITREDVRRAIEAAKAVSLPTGRESARVAAGLRRGRAGRHRRTSRHDRRAARSERPHHHRQPELHPEHRCVCEPRGRRGGRNRR